MQRLLAYLQLCRFAAVFTALADICLGYLLTHNGIVAPRAFALLLGASAGLYLAGMVFNDVFDREVDALERPRRPIPSGRVPLPCAVILGTCLALAGFASALAAGTQSTLVAGLLVACIFLYDGVLKSTVAGPLVMGACRFLNVMLGASTAFAFDAPGPTFAAVWSLPQLHVAAGLGIYIAGVTWFARHEAGQSGRVPLAGAIGIVNLGIVLLIAFVLHWRDDLGRSWNAALALGFIGMIINRRLMVALSDPVPAKVQAGVRTMLMSLVTLDATLVFFVQEDRTYAFAVVALLIPAQILARFLAVT
jgi:4-hydroxybenzoate polyprenyltransferase